MKQVSKSKKNKQDHGDVLMSCTLMIPSQGWKELVDYPHVVSHHELIDFHSVALLFVDESPGNSTMRAYPAAISLLHLHVVSFVTEKTAAGTRPWVDSWADLFMDERREIYRRVGLALGYDF